jgi:hypothetical protein
VSTSADGDFERAIEEAKKECGDYEATVQALCALVSLTICQEGAIASGGRYSFGRRMRTSSQNRVTRESVEVTPDAVIQQSQQLGYISEAKATLPEFTDFWSKRARQIFKYDDDLTGWWTDDGRIPMCDLVCLIGAPDTTKFANFVEQHGQQHGWGFNRKQCYLEISYTKGGECLYLKLERGALTDTEILKAVYEGREFPREDLIADFNGAKFYDGTPPPELVMELLWHDVFTRRRSTEKIERDASLGYYPLDVSVSDLTNTLQKEYGSRGASREDVQYPTQESVKDALDAFVRMNLAKHESGDKYLIKFRHLRGELIEKFAEQRLKPPPTKPPLAVQLALPEI